MSVRRKSGEREDHETDHESHDARRLLAAEYARYRAHQSDDEDRRRQEPMAHHAAGSQAEQDRDHIQDTDDGEMHEALISALMRGVVVPGRGGIFVGSVVGHGEMSPGIAV